MKKSEHRRTLGSPASLNRDYIQNFRLWKPLLKKFIPGWVIGSLRGIIRAIKVRCYIRKLDSYRLQGKQIIHILHIGKTGGTSIKEALKSSLTTNGYRIELHGHSFTLRDVPKGDKVVFFLRDPISRFVSGFNTRKRMGRPRYYSGWSDDEKVAFAQFNTPNELALALSSEAGERRKSAARAMRVIQHVRSSYWDWFKNEAYFLSRSPDILFIGFQEKLDQDFTLLKKLIDFPEEIILPTDEIKSHRNPNDMETNLDKKAIENLLKWYEKDYQFIALCRNKVIAVGANREVYHR